MFEEYLPSMSFVCCCPIFLGQKGRESFVFVDGGEIRRGGSGFSREICVDFDGKIVLDKVFDDDLFNWGRAEAGRSGMKRPVISGPIKNTPCILHSIGDILFVLLPVCLYSGCE